MDRYWKRSTNPTVEPISLTEAKSHLRVEVGDDDTLITNLIKAAREFVEETTWRSLITQTWQLDMMTWPSGDYIELPRPPLQSVTSVVYVDSDDTSNTFSASSYDVDTTSEPGRVVLAYGASWPSATLRPMNPIRVTYVAGYGSTSASVPELLRQMILLLVGHWYENRESIVVGAGVTVSQVPLAVDSLMKMWRCSYAL